MTIFFVSHFHWDREWYRPMQAFRARLVDAVDRVLDLLEADPEHHFLLDGQTVVLEDYLAIRPDRENELRRRVSEGRLAIGPWYVQPDSLLPVGEAHVRNLLAGRRVGNRFGRVSTVAYVPDSFGHPGQFPQLFAGFGLDGFVYWRGNGNELDRLGPRWRWRAPDGTVVRALHLTEGYFCAAGLDDPETGLEGTVERLASVADKLREAGEEPVLLMNGFDHLPPDQRVGEIASRLADRVDEPVVRGLLDDAVAAAPGADALEEYAGELVGGRVANLLPGVWSARMPLKTRNRRCETALLAWAEPWAAIGAAMGLPDERPGLRLAWQSLLRNQAHDSICGCSTDATHDRMLPRYDDAERLASETTRRLLERLAGQDPARRTPWSDRQTVAVFNPSPHTRTDVVRLRVDPGPGLFMSAGDLRIHPLVMLASGEGGLAVDGVPARVLDDPDPGRVRWIPGQRALDVEFVAADIPAFGYRAFALTPCEAARDDVDAGTVIANDDVSVEVAANGTIDVRIGDREWSGLFAIDDQGDRGDSYDFDPVGAPTILDPRSVAVERRRHPSGLQTLTVRRELTVPVGLDHSRDGRASESVTTALTLELRIAPGVPRVDARLRLHDPAHDHRLRLIFPSARACKEFSAATTFGISRRSTTPADDSGWQHPAPRTFCHQGWVAVGDLTVVAPGLPEAEVAADGTLAITLVRSVGWLARIDLRSRPVPAGPEMEAQGAQVDEAFEVELSILAGGGPAEAAEAAAGLTAVLGGPDPLVESDRALLSLAPEVLVLSAVKPAEDGDGVIVRVLNPTDTEARAELTVGFPFTSVEPARLDEQEHSFPLDLSGANVRFAVPADALRTVRIRSANP